MEIWGSSPGFSIDSHGTWFSWLGSCLLRGSCLLGSSSLLGLRPLGLPLFLLGSFAFSLRARGSWTEIAADFWTGWRALHSSWSQREISSDFLLCGGGLPGSDFLVALCGGLWLVSFSICASWRRGAARKGRRFGGAGDGRVENLSGRCIACCARSCGTARSSHRRREEQCAAGSPTSGRPIAGRLLPEGAVEAALDGADRRLVLCDTSLAGRILRILELDSAL